MIQRLARAGGDNTGLIDKKVSLVDGAGGRGEQDPQRFILNKKMTAQAGIGQIHLALFHKRRIGGGVWRQNLGWQNKGGILRNADILTGQPRGLDLNRPR